MSIKVPSYQELKSVMLAKGYRFYDEGDYNLNLIGIRNADLHANSFNDLFIVAFKVKGVEQVMAFDCTTDPGIYWRENLANVKGTGWLKPGQYRSMWTFGRHQGKYPALVQYSPVTMYRDNDRDGLLETLTEETGMFGINGHRANEKMKSKNVDKWSAGCQVLASPFDFDMVLSTCRKAATIHGDKFTYTLLEQKDLPAPVTA
jgi:hypothetical protein